MRAFESLSQFSLKVIPVRMRNGWMDSSAMPTPSKRSRIGEAIAIAYQSFTEKRTLTLDAKTEAFGLLLVRSSGDEQHTLSGATLRHLNRADAEELLRLYSLSPQPISYQRK
jgi:hypothetical protein